MKIPASPKNARRGLAAWNPLCLLKRRLILSSAIVLASATTFIGCIERLNDGYDIPSIRTYANSVFLSGADVYVAGVFEVWNAGTMTAGSRARLWKNGVIQPLGGLYLGSSTANSVFVSGNDVYVAGGSAVWKNNEFSQSLTFDGNSTLAGSVFVSGGDVYVAGAAYINRPVPVIWKNGVAQLLNVNEESYRGEALSVFVSEGDLYVAGYERSGGGINDIAVIWKNGVPQYLTDGSRPAAATSVFVSDGDVYVTGSNGSLWKNGDIQRLTLDDSYSAPVLSSVFVSGGDVYVAGTEMLTEDSRAVIWKNGSPQYLANKDSHSNATSVFVSGNDVYVAGSVRWVATIWKNGVARHFRH